MAQIKSQIIAVIGGGAAGLMAAATITELQPEYEVVLIEKNAVLGRKVMISGGGRCNVTTGLNDIREVLERYPRGKKFLNSAFHSFSPQAVMQWFEDHGVPLKIEADLRVFPQSNNGKDVVEVFNKLFFEHQVNVLLRQHVTKIHYTNNKFYLQCNTGEEIIVDKVIITTGGQAYRHTGSTGEGYSFAEQLGHTITPLAASLNSFVLQETWPAQLAGVSLEQIGLQAGNEHWSGPIVFTHKGISGPAVFALSSLIAMQEYSAATPLALQLDFVPSDTEQKLFEYFTNTFREHPKQLFKKTLHKFLTWSLCDVMLNNLGIPETSENQHISKKNIHATIQQLKHCTMHIIGRGAGDEFVTAGGVELKEVNPKTMESKICPGLFFAGEILNIDGFTGGFNLQAAWATGRAAGMGACL